MFFLIKGQRPLADLGKIINGTASIPGDWSWNVIIFIVKKFYGTIKLIDLFL
jgi:hypothetical protein